MEAKFICSDGTEVKRNDLVKLDSRHRKFAGFGYDDTDGQCGLFGVWPNDIMKVEGVYDLDGDLVVRFDAAGMPWCPVSWVEHAAQG